MQTKYYSNSSNPPIILGGNKYRLGDELPQGRDYSALIEIGLVSFISIMTPIKISTKAVIETKIKITKPEDKPISMDIIKKAVKRKLSDKKRNKG